MNNISNLEQICKTLRDLCHKNDPYITIAVTYKSARENSQLEYTIYVSETGHFTSLSLSTAYTAALKSLDGTFSPDDSLLDFLSLLPTCSPTERVDNNNSNVPF